MNYHQEKILDARMESEMWRIIVDFRFRYIENCRFQMNVIEHSIGESRGDQVSFMEGKLEAYREMETYMPDARKKK